MLISDKCGNSSVGRARPCQGRGREFEPRFPLQFARVVESVDTRDLKSLAFRGVPVQVWPRAPFNTLLSLLNSPFKSYRWVVSSVGRAADF